METVSSSFNLVGSHAQEPFPSEGTDRMVGESIDSSDHAKKKEVVSRLAGGK
jgi:hypothetical protein